MADFESPYVHRCSAYLKDLEKNWAYKDTDRKPKFRQTNQG